MAITRQLAVDNRGGKSHESPILSRGMQVRGCGSSYAQACTQFIQGIIPMDPD